MWTKGLSAGIAVLFVIGPLSESEVLVVPGKSQLSISITSPAPGSSVATGNLTVTGIASSKTSIKRVQVKADSGSWVIATGTGSWSATVQIPAASGTMTLTAQAFEASGASATTTETIQVIPQDSTAPTVAITNPASGATVSGAVTVAGTASDVGLGVDLVEVGVDAANYISAAGTANWNASLDLSAATPGAHEIDVRATDAAGNVGTASVNVTVAAPTSSQPGPIVGQGYSLAWSDEFDSLSYNNTGSINDAYTWQRPFNGANTAGTAQAGNGLLTMTYTGGVGGKILLLSTRKSVNNFDGSFAPPVYFEARIKLPGIIGTYPQWWMASAYQAWGLCCTSQAYDGSAGGTAQTFNPTLNPEIDVVEGGYGTGVGAWTGGPKYTNTPHSNTAGGTGSGNTCGIADVDPTVVLAEDGSAFHTYGVLWDNTGITFYQDDVSTHAKFTSPTLQPQPVFLVLGLGAHSNFVGSLPSSYSMLVDWVRVWQK